MQLRLYQKKAVDWLTARHNGALFADPGTGKTLIILTLLRRLSLLNGPIRTLVVAPLRVVYNVWPLEAKKWGHKGSLTILHGPNKQKRLAEKSAITLINPEGLKWFSKFFDAGHYDVLILDESSLFRNPTSVRMKIFKKMLPKFKYRYILTGTPSPNSLQDLWSQMFVVDLGETLGSKISHFRAAYCYKEPFGDRMYKYHLIPGMEEKILDRVAPSCHRISAETCLSLPGLFINDIYLDMPPAVMKSYKKIEKNLFAEIKGQERILPTAAVKYGICRQMAGGAVYKEDPSEGYDTLHRAKLDALVDLKHELNGKPLLIVFNFKHELDRLKKLFGPKLPAIAGGVSEKEVKHHLKTWNTGKTSVLAAQARSVSHGLNMQAGGNDIVWYTLTDDYDTYEQLNRRLYRSGVKGSVRIHRLLAKGTIDLVVAARLTDKYRGQQGLFNALVDYEKGLL